MDSKAFAVALLVCLAVGVALADDPVPPSGPVGAEPAQVPRTNVDSTVVGSNAGASTNDGHLAYTGLDNDHRFEPGAPELVKATKPLHLSARQKAKMHDLIEQADADAATLIKRENAVREMMAATTPADPMFLKLQSEQATDDSRWNDNRSSLRQGVSDLLTPAQRAKFEQSQTKP